MQPRIEMVVVYKCGNIISVSRGQQVFTVDSDDGFTVGEATAGKTGVAYFKRK